MTGYADPLFPLPEPTFMWVHTATLNRTSQAVPDTDDQGWPVTGTVEHVTVRCYVAPPDPRTLQPTGMAVDAVILVGRAVTAHHRDTITVGSGQALPPMMVGTYRIEQVRPTASHIRLLCTRVLDPENAEA